MATVLDYYLENLKGEEFEKAVRNTPQEMLLETNTFCHCLSATFVWQDTPEGSDYWRGIFNRITHD